MTNATKTETLTAGTKIYYTGDMANRDGFGTISTVIEDRFGTFYNIVMNDGRVFRSIMHCQFGTRPGDRFWTKADRDARNAAALADMKARLSAAGIA